MQLGYSFNPFRTEVFFFACMRIRDLNLFNAILLLHYNQRNVPSYSDVGSK